MPAFAGPRGSGTPASASVRAVHRPPVLVAVVSYNTARLLDACLHALRPDAEAGRVSVTVVDNASSDGSPEQVADNHPWVRLIASSKNLGFGPAVNLAVAKEPEHEWVAPANADTAVEPRAITALLAAGARDPAAGVLAPRLILPDGSTQHSVHAFPTLPFTIAFHARVGDRRPAWGEAHCLPGRWNPERERRVPWAVGAFLLVRMAAWRQVGGFDPRQWMYAEDLDLAWRMARVGWATRYVPEARVRHHESAAAEAAWGADRAADRWNLATYEWMLHRRGGLRTRAVAAANVVGHGARMVAAKRRKDGAGSAKAVAVNRAWMKRHAVGLRPRRALTRRGG